MNVPYRTFFGLEREPFGAELALSEILKTPDILAVKERFDYTIRLGAVALVTGEIGSGKSTAIRYASGSLHPSEIPHPFDFGYIGLHSGTLPTASRSTGYRYIEPISVPADRADQKGDSRTRPDQKDEGGPVDR